MIGALIGDICGSVYEFNNIKTKEFPLLSRKSVITDDSVMSIAVADMCNKDYLNNKAEIINTFKKWGRKFPNAGYGGNFYYWVLGNDRKPYYSCGNGSAMRISAIGWVAKNEQEVIKYSKAVTEVTHNHPEGILGAEVTAMCIYYARTGKDKEFIKKYIEQNYDIDFDYEELRASYEHAKEICQVTVPQALYCFLISKDFEDCLRTTISIGGDCDTTAAISCAVAEAYYGVPQAIEEAFRERIPNSMLEVLDDFEHTYGKNIIKD